MKNHLRLKTLVASATLVLAALPYNAQSASWMEDYFNSAGAAMNVSPPAVYEAQNQSVISGGGFSYRAPQRKFQPFSFSPPGYKAGCGGIDAYLGAYGFANKAQFIAALKNIGQNAVGYFFKLALKTMAPEIDATLQQIADVMNQLNNMQIGGCQAMQRSLANAPDTRAMDFDERAKAFGSSVTGAFSDFFEATQAVSKSLTESKKAVADACNANAVLCKDSEGKPILKRESNLVFDALKRTGGYTDSEIEYFISVLGTVIFKNAVNPDDNSAGINTTYHKPLVNWEEFMGKPDAPSSIKVRECNDYVTCLDMQDDASATTVSFTGFSQIVNDALNKIADAIDTRVALADPAAMQVMAMTQTPIYRLIADSITTGHGKTVVTSNIINLYSEVIATEIAYHHLIQMQREVNDAINTYKTATFKADTQGLEEAQKGMQVIAQQAIDIYSQKQANSSSLIQNIHLQLAFQKTMFDSLGKNLVGNIEFQKKHE
ncbi:MAG: conjugal transfer protein TraH [Methylophilaceae bacterium]